MLNNLLLVFDMGVSENSVPLNPMVLLIIIPFLNGYFIGNINPTFSDKPIVNQEKSNLRSKWIPTNKKYGSKQKTWELTVFHSNLTHLSSTDWDLA